MRKITCPLLQACLLLVIPAAVCVAQTASTPAPPQASSWLAPTSELNQQLPFWLRFTGEERLRLEGYSQGFANASSDSYLLNRFRFDMKLLPTRWLKFDFQTQDSRAFFKNQKPYGPPYQDTWDLTSAYVEVGSIEEYKFATRVGRQSMILGDGRLVGTSDWGNTGKTYYDEARTMLKVGKVRLDAFAATPVVQQDGQPGNHNFGNYLEGLYGGLDNVIPGSTIEPYFFWRRNQLQKMEDGKLGNEHFGTSGFRTTGKLPVGFDYNSELAFERGSIATDTIDAWASHVSVGHLLPFKETNHLHLVAEYNFASGGNNVKAGEHNTFDTLFASNHDKYGLTDQIGWKNIEHIRSGIEFNPAKKITTTAKYSDFWLANSHDALYSTTNAVVARSANGMAGRWVGQEFDATAAYSTTKVSRVGVGFGYLLPGTFLKMTTAGHPYSYPYMFYNTQF